MTPAIRTLGGDLPAEEAGPTYVHEHLIIDSPLVEEMWPHIHLPSVDEAVEEVTDCIRSGVRMMVDAMPAASGRDVERLARVSVLTGMRVVASTGLHTARYYEEIAWTSTETPDQLAERFVADIEIGIDRHDYMGEEQDRTDLRAGILKVGALTEALTDRDRRVFEAAAMTSERTGVPILTHTEGGRGGIEQITELMALGVDPRRIALSHTDKVTDSGYHREMLSTGVNLCYDQALRWEGENETARLILDMVAAGFVGQILLGTDGARRSLWASLGGTPGLAWLHEGFVDILQAHGLTGEQIEGLFVDNPASYLSLEDSTRKTVGYVR